MIRNKCGRLKPTSELACAFAQDEFLDLAGRRRRQRAEHDRFWRLEMRELIPAKRNDLVGGRVDARLELHEGAGSLAPFLIGPRHHGCELYRRVLVERDL